MTPTIESHIETAADVFHATAKEVLGRSRQAHIAKARQFAYCLCRKDGMTLQKIGEAFGRHHSTILYGIRSFTKEMELMK